MIVDLELINDINHCLGPKTMSIRDALHFFDEVVIGDSAADILTKREWGNGGVCDQCNLHLRIVPSILHRVGMKGNFGTDFHGDFIVVADGIAETNVVLADFEKGGGAALIKHAANDGS